MSPQPAPSETDSRSTGPRTEAGKAASSQNALRHGLASGALLIPGEDPAEFESLLNGLLADWEPETNTERLLIHNMAKHQWLIDRAIRLQGEVLTASPCPTVLPASFAVLLRYQTTNERAYYRAQKSLEDWQMGRQQFVSQQEAQAVKAQQNELLASLTRPFPPSRTAEHFEKMLADRKAAAVPSP